MKIKLITYTILLNKLRSLCFAHSMLIQCLSLLTGKIVNKFGYLLKNVGEQNFAIPFARTQMSFEIGYTIRLLHYFETFLQG